jgi:hypothetical protein
LYIIVNAQEAQIMPDFTPDDNFGIEPDDVDPRKQEPMPPPQDGVQIERIGAGDPTYELIRKVVIQVNEARPDGISLGDISSLVVQFLMQMMLFLTVEQLHQVIHTLINIAYHNVQKQDWVSATDDKPVPPPVIAEHAYKNPEMYRAYKAGVDDDALKKLLEEEGG